MCRFVSRAVWYGFSIHSRFCSEADMLCHRDRWNFWQELFCGGGFSSTVVSQRRFGAMEKGKSTLVTKMSMCYWRDGGGTGVCYAICTWNLTRSLRNPGTATSTATTPKHPIHPLQAKSKFPVLQKYFGCWPVDDLLKAYLKNSSSKWQKGQSKKLSEKGLTVGNKGDKNKRRLLRKSSPNLH